MSTDLKSRDLGVAEQDPRPIVDLPRTGLPGIAIAIVGLIAAILLFLLLDAQRRAPPELEDAPATAFAPPPPLVIQRPTAREITAAPPVEPIVVPPPPLPAPVSAPAPPSSEPMAPQPSPPPMQRPLPPPAPRQQSVSGPALVMDQSAGRLAVGTLIPAVLETPIDTSRPGMARALVSRHAMDAEGRVAVIPRGSRLIGEYQADVRSGQNRVLVNWTSVILPNGLTVRLASPAADEMGGVGIPGQVHGPFLSGFLKSALQTALTVGGNLIARPVGNTVVVGLPGAAAAVTKDSGAAGGSGNRRITVRPGKAFNVFVAQELDFSDKAPPK